jgi:hypothetical protein
LPPKIRISWKTVMSSEDSGTDFLPSSYPGEKPV